MEKTKERKTPVACKGSGFPAASAFLLLILMGALHPQSEEPAACSMSQDEFNAYAFVAVALALTSSAIGLAYMYSHFKVNPQLSMWAKDEAYNMVISILLFAGIIAFVSASCAISAGYVGKDPFEASVDYLDRLINNNGLNVLKYLTHQSLENQKSATAYLYMGFTPFSGNGVAKAAAYRALSSQKELVMDIYLPILASLNAQKFILQALQWVSLSLLLPFSFALRLIPPTRDMGNIMIALFFTLYVIVPAAYAMGAKAFAQITEGPIVCMDCSSYTFNTFGLDGDQLTGKSTVLYRLGSTIPQAVFLPNLVLIIAITGAMAVSKALRALAV